MDGDTSAMNLTSSSGRSPHMRPLLSFLLIAALGVSLSAQTRSYDVVVAGAGSGGTAAAIQAARLGAHVLLLEETDWLGGQMGSAGVSTMDEGSGLTPPSGLYREFVELMAKHYGNRPVNTCYTSLDSHCYEPRAIRAVLQQMIDDTNAKQMGHIELVFRDRVTKVFSQGKRVTGVETARHGMILSKVLIDATEFGDVLPLTPAAFRAGQSVGLKAATTCVQDITYVMILKKYPNGVPRELRMEHPPQGYEEWAPRFRAVLQKDGNRTTRVPLPTSFAMHNAYRGLPDPGNSIQYQALDIDEISKVSMNWFNDYPTTTEIFDRAKRQKFVCAAKLKTMMNLFYIQHELGGSDWSVANDEGYDTAFNREDNSCPNIPREFKAIEMLMPQAPYVRESMRLVGLHTLTGGEIRRPAPRHIAVTNFPDSIAVGDYPDDMHGCNTEPTLEHNLERLTDKPYGSPSGPMQVPLETLIPTDTDGLLAAEKNISASRIANGAVRLQPITMLTGEAAGTLAALAVLRNVQPREVPAVDVQTELLRSGSILAMEPMDDLAQGSLLWQAAQFAVSHQWISMKDGRNFDPGAYVSRVTAAVMLAKAFNLIHPSEKWVMNPTIFYQSHLHPRYASSFSDLPLYADGSEAAEELLRANAVAMCEKTAKAFCPTKQETAESFVRSASLLSGRQLTPVQGPLTRQIAAEVLWEAIAPHSAVGRGN